MTRPGAVPADPAADRVVLSPRKKFRLGVVFLGLLAITLAGGGTVGVLRATPAAAAEYVVAYTDGDGVAVRSAPTADSKLAPPVVLSDGTSLNIICQKMSSDGSAVGPRSNQVFDQIFLAPLANPDVWVPDAYVSGTAPANQFTPGIPQCDEQGSSDTPAAPSGWAPDLGVYCALNLPVDGDGTNYELADPNSGVDGDNPVCYLNKNSAGDLGEGLGSPAFYQENVEWVGDWGMACRMNYGPQAYVQRQSDGSVLCENVDWSYNADAQSQATQAAADAANSFFG